MNNYKEDWGSTWASEPMPVGPQRQPHRNFTIDVRPESIHFYDDRPRFTTTAPVQRTPWMTALWHLLRTGKNTGRIVEGIFSGNMVDDEGHEWELEQYLGSGTYAVAALWHKVDNNGALRDQIVLKASAGAHRMTGSQLLILNPNPILPREAALMAQLNARVKTDQGVYDPFVYLRQYKHSSLGDDLFYLGKSCTSY
jgi:hypothetical protein